MEIQHPKFQSIINKCIKAMQSYEQFNSLRDIADNEGNEREYSRLCRKCEIAFDRYLTYLEELPKYIQKQIESKYF